jgi:hypothetical protein
LFHSGAKTTHFFFTSLIKVLYELSKKNADTERRRKKNLFGFPFTQILDAKRTTPQHRRRREKMASISASFVSVAPQKRAVNSSKKKCASQTSVSSRAFSRGTSASFSGESVSCARLTQKMNGSNRGQRRVTTMAAKVAGYIKLAIEAGKANPAPPIGPALGAKVRFPSA